MRCPKCSYLSYEDVTRCRNCGYDFALAVPPEPADAPTLDVPTGARAWDDSSSRTPGDPADEMGVDEETAAVDLPLFDPPAPLEASETPVPSAPPVPAPAPAPAPRAAVPPRVADPPRVSEPSRTPERPRRTGALDAPPVPIPPAPPPLVVRRTVDLPRSTANSPAGATRHGAGRTRPGAPPPPALDFDVDADETQASDLLDGLADLHDDASPRDQARDATRYAAAHDALHDDGVSGVQAPSDGASLGARVVAGAVDGGLLIGINVVVVWLTLRLLGLTPSDWSLLPLAPLIGFLCLLDFSYLVTFTTASGQTIGKMFTNLRITMENGARVPFGHAVVRSVALLLCAMPLGLGLLPVLLDADGRGLHDRMAGTRVGLAE